MKSKRAHDLPVVAPCQKPPADNKGHFCAARPFVLVSRAGLGGSHRPMATLNEQLSGIFSFSPYDQHVLNHIGEGAQPTKMNKWKTRSPTWFETRVA